MVSDQLTFVNGSGYPVGVARLALPERERGVCCPPRTVLRPEKADDVVDLLRALGDPTRLQMALIFRAAEAPLCVCDLVATFDLGQPTVSHHVAKLREAGLLESTKRGIWTYYRLRSDLSPAARRILAAL
jgi:ArsR family transcriptional regulator